MKRERRVQGKVNGCSRRERSVSPVDAGDVDDYVDHIAAQFVGLHVHRRAVGGDVNFTNNIKQEGLLNPRMLQNRKGGVKGEDARQKRGRTKANVQR